MRACAEGLVCSQRLAASSKTEQPVSEPNWMWHEKRPLRTPKQCVLHDSWEIPLVTKDPASILRIPGHGDGDSEMIVMGVPK
jgi:hypothetical protein